MPISQKLVWQGVREIAQEKIQVTTLLEIIMASES